MTHTDVRAATPEELAEYRRKCWAPDCNRTARLEWCGWKYCLRHYWRYVVRDAPTLAHKLVKIRFTRFYRPR